MASQHLLQSRTMLSKVSPSIGRTSSAPVAAAGQRAAQSSASSSVP
jgi:hypothetical protein